MSLKKSITPLMISGLAITTMLTGGIGANAQATENIVEVASGNEDFSTLVAAVTAADLAGTLTGPGPFTVLAPTNDAFAALPDGVVDALLLPENKEELTQVLTYHVISGELDSTAVTAAVGTSVATVEGSEVAISENDGNLFVNESQVIIPDVEATNGVIHAIDNVLIPQSLDVDALLATGIETEDHNLVRTGGVSANNSLTTFIFGLGLVTLGVTFLTLKKNN